MKSLLVCATFPYILVCALESYSSIARSLQVIVINALSSTGSVHDICTKCFLALFPREDTCSALFQFSVNIIWPFFSLIYCGI